MLLNESAKGVNMDVTYESREGTMRRSRRIMRRAILSRLFEHLRTDYGLEWPEDTFLSGQISEVEIDGILAFKSDPKLDELRGALERLENGTFGICIGCKRQIRQSDLDKELTRRVCTRCEKQFVNRLVESPAPHPYL